MRAPLSILILYLLGAACTAEPAHSTPASSASAAGMSERERALDRGEVLVRSRTPTGGDGVAAEVYGVVDAPPEKVFAVVDDCARFSEFMPRTKRSLLRGRQGEAKICFVEIAMPFPISNLSAETLVTTRALGAHHFIRKWTLREGTYKRNNGSWEVRPWRGNPGRALLIYSIDVNPDILIPDAIIRRAQTSQLPDLYQAIRARVRALEAE